MIGPICNFYDMTFEQIMSETSPNTFYSNKPELIDPIFEEIKRKHPHLFDEN